MSLKTEILANLRDFNNYHGILFTSEEAAVEHYKELTELIEALILKYAPDADAEHSA
jgi:hypothetical protein